MSYQSPIELIQTQMEERIRDKIYEAVVSVGVNVDKEELLKALAYDRCQYQKGYADRAQEIVRCKDCKHHDPEDGRCDFGNGIIWNMPRQDDWFCADGERCDESCG